MPSPVTSVPLDTASALTVCVDEEGGGDGASDDRAMMPEGGARAGGCRVGMTRGFAEIEGRGG